ncbi:hypothetical protein KR044_001886, partial [Drosophila immigrans]
TCLYIFLLFQEAVVFKFTNVVCESCDKSWAVVNNCRLRAINRNKTVFNMNVTLLHPSSKILIYVQVFKRANGYKPWLFKFTIDACKFLKKPSNPVASLIYGLFKEFSNINHSCPYVGDQIVKGFYLRPELLRLPFPTGDYLLAANWIYNNKIRAVTNISFAFIEDL